MFDRLIPNAGRRVRLSPRIAIGFSDMSSRRLYEVRADGTTVAHARDLENVMNIAPRPEGTLLLMQGTNPEDDIGKISIEFVTRRLRKQA